MVKWRREQTGWVFHRQGVSWHKVPLPAGWWWRIFHRCIGHTTSVHGREVTQRCTCGAARFGEYGPQFLPAAVAAQFPPWEMGRHGNRPPVPMGSWKDRNSRYKGTALVYRPHVHALEEQT